MRAYEIIVRALTRTIANVSPVTVAVAITALSAATLFVVTDTIRTFSENDGELQIVEAVMSEIGTSRLAPASLTTMPIAAKGPLFEGIDGEALGAVLQRGSWAFVAAFLVIAVAWRRRDGTVIVTDEVAAATQDPELQRMLATVQEQQRVLARRYYEEKLKAELANNSKISFLSHLSHDIRTPLNHIIGFADLMRHETYGPLGDARYTGYVDTIKGSGERLLAFFASILELAEFESGEKELRQDPILADELTRTATSRFRAQAMRAGIALITGAPTGAKVIGDRFCLERMLGNLIDNAIRFTPQGGRVTVAAYDADNGIVLEVTDTGIGMAAERLQAVSQPFAFAFGDAALTREHGGTGLGISIARAIAEQSGGRLVIDSRPGMGTTVAVSLPLRPMDFGVAA